MTFSDLKSQSLVLHLVILPRYLNLFPYPIATFMETSVYSCFQRVYPSIATAHFHLFQLSLFLSQCVCVIDIEVVLACIHKITYA